MNENKWRFIPTATFGSAENIFFHSKFALGKKNLSLDEIDCILTDIKENNSILNLVFASHLLEQADYQNKLSKIGESYPQNKFIIIAYGSELISKLEKIEFALSFGWRILLGIDRKLPDIQLPPPLTAYPDKWSWLLLPNRHFSPQDLFDHFQQLETASPVFYSFLMPNNIQRIFFNADEVILWKEWLAPVISKGHFYEISEIAAPSEMINKNDQLNLFFNTPTMSTYKRAFIDAGNLKKLRLFILYWLNASTILGFHVFITLLSSSFWIKVAYKIRHLFIISFNFVRYDLLNGFIRHLFIISFNFVRYDLLNGFIRRLFIISFNFVRYDLLNGFIRRLFIISFNFVRYDLLNGFIRVLLILLWPMRKIYWFAEYQINKRFLKGRTDGD